jgi:nucleoid-associated protein YgaU
MSKYTKEDFSEEVTNVINPNLSRTKIITRYDGKTRIRLDSGELTLRNLKESDIFAIPSSNDLSHRVTVDEDMRPDLVALRFYGDARLYWVILAANDLRDPGDLKRNMLIRIPSKNSLYGSDGVLAK